MKLKNARHLSADVREALVMLDFWRRFIRQIPDKVVLMRLKSRRQEIRLLKSRGMPRLF